MSRPPQSKYTPECVETILTALRAGNTRTASSAYARISLDTFSAWTKRYSDFLGAVEKAEADAEVAMVANIRKVVGEGTWTAAAWWLERRRYKDWGKIDRVEHTGADGQPVEVKQVVVYQPAADDEAALGTEE